MDIKKAEKEIKVSNNALEALKTKLMSDESTVKASKRLASAKNIIIVGGPELLELAKTTAEIALIQYPAKERKERLQEKTVDYVVDILSGLLKG